MVHQVVIAIVVRVGQAARCQADVLGRREGHGRILARQVQRDVLVGFQVRRHVVAVDGRGDVLDVEVRLDVVVDVPLEIERDVLGLFLGVGIARRGRQARAQAAAAGFVGQARTAPVAAAGDLGAAGGADRAGLIVIVARRRAGQEHAVAVEGEVAGAGGRFQRIGAGIDRVDAAAVGREEVPGDDVFLPGIVV